MRPLERGPRSGKGGLKQIQSNSYLNDAGIDRNVPLLEETEKGRDSVMGGSQGDIQFHASCFAVHGKRAVW
jgi:hypothetical protein